MQETIGILWGEQNMHTCTCTHHTHTLHTHHTHAYARTRTHVHTRAHHTRVMPSLQDSCAYYSLHKRVSTQANLVNAGLEKAWDVEELVGLGRRNTVSAHHTTLHQSTLHHNTLLHMTLHTTPRHTTPHHSTLHHTTPHHTTP